MTASVSKRTVVDLRVFLDDLAIWGCAEGSLRVADTPLPGLTPLTAIALTGGGLRVQ